MTSTPAGSAVFFSFSLLTIAILVLLLLRYYLPLRTTPAFVLVPVFLAIALPASIILLVPIDLASSAGTDTDGNRGIWLVAAVVYKCWRVAYWLTFALTWAILPILGEYCDSGYREPKDRFMYSLRSNAHYYFMMLGIGILGAVYFFLQNGWHWETFKGLVMALAYTWGLFLAVYLMGHGLVAFPRSLYRYASISGRLKRLQGRAPGIHEKLTDAFEKLEQCEAQVVQLKQRKNTTTKDFQDWIEELVDMSSLPESRNISTSSGRAPTVPSVITERYLADLSRKLKRARHAKMRFSDEWDRLVRKAVDTQAILDASGSQRLQFKNSAFDAPSQGIFSRVTILTPYTRYHLYAHVIPALYYLLAFLLTLASISMVWSEIVKSLDTKLSLVGHSVVHHPGSNRGQIGSGGQLIAASWLCYMCICTFFSLAEVKIWGNRALVKRGTYQESATWYGVKVAQLTVPLAYNFVTLLPPNVYLQTSFHRFLGQFIVLTPLGKGFQYYFPALIILPVVASLFNLYGKIRNICGLGDLLEDEDDNDTTSGTGSWREGRAIIDREVSGATGNMLGLSSRNRDDRDTSPLPPVYRDDPSVTNGGRTERSRDVMDRRERRRRAEQAEEEEGGFFSDFADRVRNTFDTADFRRPRWMGGDDDSNFDDNRLRGSDDNEESRGSWTRLFGGGSAGRIRL